MKFECPKCQNQLKFFREHIYHEEIKINKRTGKLNKKTETVFVTEHDLMGIGCTNNNCDFRLSGTNQMQLLEELNEELKTQNAT